ncbi:reverse transcriptase domain-containing protein [Tanacetum coccineum]
MIQPEPGRSTQGYPLDSVEVLRYDTKGEKVDPHGFKGYSNQPRANDKAIFVSHFIANYFNASDEVLKLKNFKKDATLKLFKSTNQEKYEHVSPDVTSSQDGKEGGAWVEELPNVLLAHRTTPKTSNGETPFSLAYGTEAVIPAEIGIPTKRTIQGFDEENEEALRLNLNLLKEQREIATIREA